MLLQRTLDPGLWSHLAEMERWQQRLNRLLNGSVASDAQAFPSLNVWSSDEGCIVTAEIPGVDPEALELSVVNETLTVRGSRQPEPLSERDSYHRRERGFGQFTRTIQLPFRVNAEAMEARFSRGVLTVKAPRQEADKPRKITVKPDQ